MISTSDFRTKTIISKKENASINGYWPMALDIGYSSVKGFSPNNMFAFPAYAKNMSNNPKFYGDPEDDEILYRDKETGDTWIVGRGAQKMVSDSDTSDSQAELFGRNRYYTKMFLVLARVGFALAITGNPNKVYNGEPIMLETGLPPDWMDEDTKQLKSVLAKKHEFAVKIGKGAYVNYTIDILKENVFVMSQPEGTLMGLAIDDNGQVIKDAKKYYNSNIVIFDAGFGTLDFFDLFNRSMNSGGSFVEYGMERVIERTCKKIKKRDGVVRGPSAMQNALEAGSVKIPERDGNKISLKYAPFDDLLEQASNEVCKEALEKMLNIYSGLFNYKYLILTGGTVMPWVDFIKDYLKDVEGLQVVMGNESCPDTDIIFCNVRGYYMFLLNTLRKRNKS